MNHRIAPHQPEHPLVAAVRPHVQPTVVFAPVVAEADDDRDECVAIVVRPVRDPFVLAVPPHQRVARRAGTAKASAARPGVLAAHEGRQPLPQDGLHLSFELLAQRPPGGQRGGLVVQLHAATGAQPGGAVLHEDFVRRHPVDRVRVGVEGELCPLEER